MGNVQAKASSEKLPETLFDDPSSYLDPTMNSKIRMNGAKLNNNPGTYEELHKLCKDVFPSPFEGGKIVMNRLLSTVFQISHTLSMSSVNNSSGYRFGTTYVGSQYVTPSECFPVLFGDIDPQGNLNANIVHQFSGRIRCKLASMIQSSKISASQLSADFRADESTFSLTVCNPNLFSRSGIVLAHFLQNVYPGVSIGAELAYQCGNQVPGGESSALAAAGRIENGVVCVSGSVGQAGVHLCYHRKASDQLQISAEFETNFRTNDTFATLGYQVDLPVADVVFRASLDSNLNVCAVLEGKMNPLPVSFAFSGHLNHGKNQFRLGCGIVI